MTALLFGCGGDDSPGDAPSGTGGNPSSASDSSEGGSSSASNSDTDTGPGTDSSGSSGPDDSGTAATGDPAGTDVVELVLTEPAGVQRGGAHVRWGVPLPQGLVAPDEPLVLVDASDVVLATQTRDLARWPDGSRRWVSVDAVANLAPGEIADLTLRVPDNPSEVTNPLTVVEEAASITIDTGPLQVEIDKQSGAVLRRAWVDDTLVLDAPSGDDRGPFVRTSGVEYLGIRTTPTSTPAASDAIAAYRAWGEANLDRPANRYDPFELEVVVEQQGPVHAVVRVSGTHLSESGASTGTFVIRVHATRGHRHLRMDQTFVYTAAGGEGVESYGFRLPTPGDDDHVEGASGSGGVTHLRWDEHQVGGQTVDGAAQGFVSRGDGSTGQAVVLRDMAERFPKALVLQPDRLEVQLHPAAAPTWTLERYSNTLDTANGETGGTADRGAQGLSTTDTWIWAPFVGAADQDDLQDRAIALDAGPLTLDPPRDWTSDARVMGYGGFSFPLGEGAVHDRVHAALRVTADFMRINQRRQYGWFGIEDYGDIRGLFDGGNASFTWSELGRYGWSGNSGEPSNQLWVQYLRSPSRDTLLDAEALARHTLDQTVVHYGDATSIDDSAWNGRNREFAVGSQHRHGRQAWSGYAGLPEYSHIAGVETWYYLSGDERARDVLYEAAEFITRYGPDTPAWTGGANGIDVLSRAEAVFFDEPELRDRYGQRNDQLLDWIDADAEIGSDNLAYDFNLFVRVAPGILYHHERSGDARALQVATEIADFLAAPEDPLGLSETGSAGSVYYHFAPLAYLASLHGPSSTYYERAARILGLNCHHVDASDTGAISDASLQSIPDDWRDWTWQWDEDPLDARAPGILWIHRQLFWRNDFMQDYHSYRAFAHLAALAGAVAPTDTSCQSK